MEFKDLSRKSQWIALAVMSGACAAFNGVFAKLYVILCFSMSIVTWRNIYAFQRDGNAGYMYAPDGASE
jgi:hypothetical protein